MCSIKQIHVFGMAYMNGLDGTVHYRFSFLRCGAVGLPLSKPSWKHTTDAYALEAFICAEQYILAGH